MPNFVFSCMCTYWPQKTNSDVVRSNMFTKSFLRTYLDANGPRINASLILPFKFLHSKFAKQNFAIQTEIKTNQLSFTNTVLLHVA